jgi:dTDP-4-amino-4,6-dideoxygalactose transaminase
VNRANYEHYKRGLAGIRGVGLALYETNEASNYHYVVVEIDAEQLGLSRDQLQQVLEAENVLARRYFYPGCHRSAPYRDLPQYREISLPQTERLSTRVLCLPTGTAVGEAQIGEVCRIISTAAAAAPEVVSRLTK